jgi:hypothetical protein
MNTSATFQVLISAWEVFEIDFGYEKQNKCNSLHMIKEKEKKKKRKKKRIHDILTHTVSLDFKRSYNSVREKNLKLDLSKSIYLLSG